MSDGGFSFEFQRTESGAIVSMPIEPQWAGLVPLLLAIGLTLEFQKTTKFGQPWIFVIAVLFFIWGVIKLFPGEMIVTFDKNARSVEQMRSFANGLWQRRTLFSYEDVGGLAIMGYRLEEEAGYIFYPVLKLWHGKMVCLSAASRKYLALESPMKKLSSATGLPFLPFE